MFVIVRTDELAKVWSLTKPSLTFDSGPSPMWSTRLPRRIWMLVGGRLTGRPPRGWKWMEWIKIDTIWGLIAQWWAQTCFGLSHVSFRVCKIRFVCKLRDFRCWQFTLLLIHLEFSEAPGNPIITLDAYLLLQWNIITMFFWSSIFQPWLLDTVIIRLANR